MVRELDVIELSVAVDSWEAGTIATVLEVSSDTLLAEVADADGRTLETLVLPIEAARRLQARTSSSRPKLSKDGRAASESKSAA